MLCRRRISLEVRDADSNGSFLKAATVGLALLVLLFVVSATHAQRSSDRATPVADVTSERGELRSGAVDEDGALAATVAILPSPPVRGRPAEVTLTVSNPRAEELIFALEGDLAATMFLGGTDGVELANAEPGRLRTGLTWPTLSLGPNSTGRLRLDTVVRGGDAGSVIVGFELQDLSRGELQRAQLTAEPEWPEKSPRVTWTAFIVGLLIALGIGLAAGAPLARLVSRKSGGGAKARLGAAGILAVALLFALAMVLFAADNYRLLTSYQAATCEVTDRLIVPAPRSIGTTSSSEEEEFYPMLAVRLSSEEGTLKAIWGDGDEPTLISGPIAWAQERVAAYQVGGTYDCWYDSDNPQFLALEREFSPLPVLLVGLVLACLAVPATLINRRLRMRDKEPAQVAAPSASRPVSLETSRTGTGNEERALIVDPMVRGAAESALKRQGGMSKLLVREGENLYFYFGLIDDPEAQKRARDLMRGMSQGEDVDLLALAEILQRWL